MNLPDLNVLLYAVNPSSPQHGRARKWLEQAFASESGVALAWITLIGFVRLSTKPGIFARPLALEIALERVQDWLQQPSAQIIHPTAQHLLILGRLLLPQGAGGNLTTDAHLAALTIEHGATLGTFDADFKLFPGLKLELLK